MFAIAGTNLFRTIDSGMTLDNRYSNFRNFGNSFLMVFRMSTGEDWHLVMYDCMELNPYYAVYFILFVIVIQNIMINLFVLVMIKEFDKIYYSLDNSINMLQFQTILADF